MAGRYGGRSDQCQNHWLTEWWRLWCQVLVLGKECRDYHADNTEEAAIENKTYHKNNNNNNNDNNSNNDSNNNNNINNCSAWKDFVLQIHNSLMLYPQCWRILLINLSFPLGHAKNIQKDLVGDGGGGG